MRHLALVALCAALTVAGGIVPSQSSVVPTRTVALPAGWAEPSPPDSVCDSTSLVGPADPPAGAVVVTPQDNLQSLTLFHPSRTTFWLAPGTHLMDQEEFGQVQPKDGNVYIGAPGAVFDGNGVNRYAFTMRAADVTIQHLTIRGFVAPGDEGVVNHDGGEGWVVANNTIENNGGAAVFLGNGVVVEGNCLRGNGQYGFNGGGRDIVLRGNEISGNNTDDWEARSPGCGCTGAGKFWGVVGALVEDNYIHDNLGPGLWADGLTSDFTIRNNYIAHNDGPGIFYEQGYNAQITGNVLIGNNFVKGAANGGFPEGAMYISEAGADPRAPGGYDTFEIAHNLLIDNWGGIILWENADRYAGSPADTSRVGTRIPGVTKEACSDPELIKTEPYFSDCRWSVKNVKVHDNLFQFDPDNVPGCDADGQPRCGHMGMGSNWGSVPDWSPYIGPGVQQAITYENDNRWFDNTYVGPWRFVAEDIFSSIDWDRWSSAPLSQDSGSTFNEAPKPVTPTPPPSRGQISTCVVDYHHRGKPVIHDFTGDGIADAGFYVRKKRATSGLWRVVQGPLTCPPVTPTLEPTPGAGDVIRCRVDYRLRGQPVIADFTGDGVADAGFYTRQKRKGTGTWRIVEGPITCAPRR